MHTQFSRNWPTFMIRTANLFVCIKNNEKLPLNAETFVLSMIRQDAPNKTHITLYVIHFG